MSFFKINRIILNSYQSMSVEFKSYGKNCSPPSHSSTRHHFRRMYILHGTARNSLLPMRKCFYQRKTLYKRVRWDIIHGTVLLCKIGRDIVAGRSFPSYYIPLDTLFDSPLYFKSKNIIKYIFIQRTWV